MNDTLEELKLLRSKIDMAITVIETDGLMKEMTPQELRRYLHLYPQGSFIIGDFVIRRCGHYHD